MGFTMTKSLTKSTKRLYLAKATRIWVQDNKHIHALNYWFYRWFTNQFELFLINKWFSGVIKK